MQESVRTLDVTPVQQLELTAFDPPETTTRVKSTDIQEQCFQRFSSSGLFCFWLTILVLCATLSVAIAVLVVAIIRIQCQ